MRVLVLGATGNIGQQALEVIKQLKYQLVGISFYKNNLSALQINTPFRYSPINKINSNVSSYDELIKLSKPDIVINAIVGFAGLEATIVTIKNKKTLCLANKESLVVAGQFITKMANRNNVKIYPIDSEDSSIYQIISQNKNSEFKKLYITASGGPFYKHSLKKLSKATYKQAVNHPTWNMGAKISVDSATLMNKCFEIIETYWYFKTTKIEALYHPSSFIHAIVQYSKAKLMFACKPDMKISIKQSLTMFRNHSKYVVTLNKNNKMILEKIDINKWLPIQWAYEVIKRPSNSLSVILNAANEEAFKLFSVGKIKYLQIIEIIKYSISKFTPVKVENISQIYAIDNNVRKFIKSVYN